MKVVELAGSGGLSHDPLSFRLTVVPAHIVDEMREHVHHPSGSGAVDGVDAAECTAGYDFLYLAVVLAVTMLMADDSFYARCSEEILHFHAFAAVECDRLLEGDQARAGFNANANHFRAQLGKSAEAEDVGLDGGGDLKSIVACRAAKFGSGCFETGLVDVADAGYFEASIGLEGEGMVHSALTHAHDYDTIFVGHFTLLSQSRTRSMV